MKHFLEFVNKLRGSDDTVKKRWLIILTAPTMFLIIIFWVVILRSELASRESGETERKSNFAESWQSFKRGSAIISERFKQGGSILKATLNERLLRTNEVSPVDFRFNLEESEPIAPKRLNQ